MYRKLLGQVPIWGLPMYVAGSFVIGLLFGATTDWRVGALLGAIVALVSVFYRFCSYIAHGLRLTQAVTTALFLASPPIGILVWGNGATGAVGAWVALGIGVAGLGFWLWTKKSGPELVKVIVHNAANINNPDDPSYPYKLEVSLRPPDFMNVAFAMMRGGSEELVLRGMNLRVLNEAIRKMRLRDHPRLSRLIITGPDGVMEELPRH